MSRSPTKRSSIALPGRWALQLAKAQFSEVVRKAHAEGPQHVTVHGRDSVVVISEKEYRQLKGEPTGQAIVDAFAASPHKEIELEQPRHKGRVRDFEL